jgi:hypothetical protein
VVAHSWLQEVSQLCRVARRPEWPTRSPTWRHIGLVEPTFTPTCSIPDQEIRVCSQDLQALIGVARVTPVALPGLAA